MTKFGNDLIDAMQEALVHARGDNPKTITHKVDVETVDAKSVRTKLKITQEQMAYMLGTSLSGYRKWEQGQRQPNGAARTLLRVMDQEPQAVLRALAR